MIALKRVRIQFQVAAECMDARQVEWKKLHDDPQ
jgi:hypothetical protein